MPQDAGPAETAAQGGGGPRVRQVRSPEDDPPRLLSTVCSIYTLSCSFLETNVPLLVLMEAARNGNEKEVEEYALVFTEHANKLVEVSGAPAAAACWWF